MCDKDLCCCSSREINPVCWSLDIHYIAMFWVLACLLMEGALTWGWIKSAETTSGRQYYHLKGFFFCVCGGGVHSVSMCALFQFEILYISLCAIKLVLYWCSTGCTSKKAVVPKVVSRDLLEECSNIETEKVQQMYLSNMC